MAREMNNYTTNVQQVAGQTATGKPVALLVGDDGSLAISGGGGGGGDASAANQLLQIAEAEGANEALALLLGYQFALWGTAMRFTGGYPDINAYGFKAITDVTIDSVTLGAGSDIAGNWVGKTIFAGDVIYLDIVSIGITGDAQFFLKPPTP